MGARAVRERGHDDGVGFARELLGRHRRLPDPELGRKQGRVDGIDVEHLRGLLAHEDLEGVAELAKGCERRDGLGAADLGTGEDNQELVLALAKGGHVLLEGRPDEALYGVIQGNVHGTDTSFQRNENDVMERCEMET